MIVVLDKGVDLSFEVARQIVIVEQDAVLLGLMPALDLALGLGMIRRAAHMLHALMLEPPGQVVRAREVVQHGREVDQPQPVILANTHCTSAKP